MGAESPLCREFTIYCVFHLSLFAESGLLNKAPPTPTMFKYRPAYSSPSKNHTALTHAYANQVTFLSFNVYLFINNNKSFIKECVFLRSGRIYSSDGHQFNLSLCEALSLILHAFSFL